MASTPRSSFHGAAAAMFLPLFSLLALAPATVATSQSVSSGGMFNGSCIATERKALLAFKAGITTDPSRRLKSWRGQDCCRWYGVSCNISTGHVMKLDLGYNFSLEDFMNERECNCLQGQISSSLLDLCSLKYLDLSGNTLGGDMPIPEFIGSLKSLTHLDLSNMNFSGQVSPRLGNLTKLVYIDIHKDFFFASYSSDVSWLASLHSLEYLDMSGVDLSTTVDWVRSVSTLPNLRVLYLSDCGLNSSIPSLLHHSNLTVLEEIDLSLNSFNSSATPNWFWELTSLKSIDITYSEFSGPFPDELGNLTMLETLHMGYNNFHGQIPSTLGNLCNLQIIDLVNTNIGGDITDLIARLPNCSWNNLQALELIDANITGTTLKSILNLTSLSILYVHRNHLSSSVPVEIGTLKKLTELRLGGNNLSGVISEAHFSGLTNLKSIDFSDTYLQVMVHPDWEPPFSLNFAFLSSCDLGSQIPSWLRWQKNISELVLSNTSLTGRIPDWFWTTFSSATYLDLSYNKITGELPRTLEFMSAETLLLQSNHLTGSVPQLPRSIKLLDISRNYLNGQLPSNFGGPYLHIASLFSNSITGIIPDSICRSPQLRTLDLSNNLLTKGLPVCGREELKQWKPSNNNSLGVHSANSYGLEIQTLLLNNNSLSGGFPLFLKQCQNLMFLDLSHNRFSGELPVWISDSMPKLVMLRLRSNYFSGHIPVETTRLISLRILDLANNTFSGLIPQSLVNLEALVTRAMDLYPLGNPFEEEYPSGDGFYFTATSDDTLSFLTKGQVLDYGKNVIYIMSIDLSCNRLAGRIPKEIGSLLGLMNLNLSSNFLSGNIPYTIGNLQSLESLDLSNNQLSGEIPRSLSNLTSLSYMNFSYNNLSGRIPTGNQMDTIRADDPTSMYIGNPGLCGHPLLKVCPGDQSSQEDPTGCLQVDKTQMDFHLGLTIGFLLGLWIIFCGLLFNKTWRYAYFSLFDGLSDKMYMFVVTWKQKFRKPCKN